jgi:hypothetical protein
VVPTPQVFTNFSPGWEQPWVSEKQDRVNAFSVQTTARTLKGPNTARPEHFKASRFPAGYFPCVFCVLEEFVDGFFENRVHEIRYKFV